MIQANFAWTFATNDSFTINYVRNEYIPKLKADIEAMQHIVRTCQADGQVPPTAMSLQESIGRQQQKVEIAESRLDEALQGRARRELAPRLAVVIEGGLVQSVVTDQLDCFSPYLEVQVIDYDTDGVDDEDLILVPQGDGSTSEARGHIESITKAGIDIGRIEHKIG